MSNPLRAALCGLVALASLALPLAAPAQADSWLSSRQTLGYGRFFDNDFLGDNKDRWQTGSYTISVIRGPSWDYELPSRPFEIMEYRAGGGIIAPSRLKNPSPTDRRYVGRLTFAAHTQFAPLPGAEADLGLGLVAVGPDTGISSLHRTLHRIFSAPTPVVADKQLPDNIYPLLTAEMGRTLELGWAEARPYVEGRAGDETLVRAGLDVSFGAREKGALWLRDDVTGHRYVGVSGNVEPQTSFVLGADIAHVFSSEYFPKADGVEVEPTRKRLRAGVSTRIGGFGIFYGLTWLSEEFKTQPEGQLTGSLRARVNF